MSEVVAGSLGLPTKLVESGDKKEQLESKARDWRFVALVLKVLVERELGVVI